ncbi:MAG: hypothetical protein ABSG85_07125 [Spirochaetia bacterium]
MKRKRCGRGSRVEGKVTGVEAAGAAGVIAGGSDGAGPGSPGIAGAAGAGPPGCGAGSGAGCPGSLAAEGGTEEGEEPLRVDIVYGT